MVPTYAVQTPLPAINLPAATTPTCTSHIFFVDLLSVMTTPGTGHSKKLPTFLVDPLQAMITTSTGHDKKLSKFSVDHLPVITPTSTGLRRESSNLAETYTDEATYNS